jgi:hypothetical protein
MKSLQRFLAFGNLAVFLAAAGMTQTFFWVLKLPSSPYPLLIGLLTTVAYSYMHIADSLGPGSNAHQVRAFTRRNRPLVIGIGSIAGISSIAVVLRMAEPILIYLLPVALLSLAYPRIGSFSGIRGVYGLKLPIISLVWSYATTFLPLWLYSSASIWSICTLSLQTFFWVFALAIAFDIRDLQYDEEGLQTLPQQSGVRKATSYALIAIGLVEVSILLDLVNGLYSWKVAIARWIPLELTSLAIWHIRKRVDGLFISFWVELLPFLGALLAGVSTIF